MNARMRTIGTEFASTPKDPDALYTEIRMTFSEKRLVRIEIVDSLGQLTDVNFHNLEDQRQPSRRTSSSSRFRRMQT